MFVATNVATISKIFVAIFVAISVATIIATKDFNGPWMSFLCGVQWCLILQNNQWIRDKQLHTYIGIDKIQVILVVAVQST